jgi:hypothetical protein
MRLDLNTEEAHWLKYALCFGIGYFKGCTPDGKHEAVAILEGILKRLKENNREGDRHG